jgi:hypothetical protein
MKTVKPLPVKKQPGWVSELKLKLFDLPFPKEERAIFGRYDNPNKGRYSVRVHFKKKVDIKLSTVFEYLDITGELRKGVILTDRDFTNPKFPKELDHISNNTDKNMYFLRYG